MAFWSGEWLGVLFCLRCLSQTILTTRRFDVLRQCPRLPTINTYGKPSEPLTVGQGQAFTTVTSESGDAISVARREVRYGAIVLNRRK